MKNEILRLLFRYSMSKCIFDKEAINRLYNIFIDNYYNIDKNLKSIEIVNDDNVDGLYRHTDKTIRLNINNIVFQMEDEIERLKLFDIQKYFYFNIQILLSLFHELEHARQLDIALGKSLYSIIIFYGKTFGISGNKDNNSLEYKNYVNELYLSTYKYNPCERGAYIESSRIVGDIIKDEFYIDKNIINYLEWLLLSEKISGYNIKNDRIISPCDTFFSMIDMSLLWESFPFYCDNDKIMYSDVKKNYTLDERLKYGFPISNFEYKRLVNSTNKLKNKILKR